MDKHFFDHVVTIVMVVGQRMPTIVAVISGVLASAWYAVRLYDWYKARK